MSGRGIPRTNDDGKRRGNIHPKDFFGWYVRLETSKEWSYFPPKYPFHSVVAKDYGAGLPLGDHTVVVKEGHDGAERYFIVTVITTTYVRPKD